LWTTSSTPPEHFQFDAFRVFMWNSGRSRYESVHIERNLRGYQPVVVDGAKIRLIYGAGAEAPIESHEFELRGRKLHRLSREKWQPPGSKPEASGPLSQAGEPKAGILPRLSAWVKSWLP
jgi:hypothetical protein